MGDQDHTPPHASEAPLVFVHGDFGDGHDAWGDVVARIGATRRTLVVDRPGVTGRLAEDRYTFAGDAAAALSEIAELGAAQIHLIGHSYGALVALAIAAARPDLIRGLHLIEPPLFAVVPDHVAAQEMNREARRIQTDHAMAGDDRSTADFFVMIDAPRALERLRGTPEWDRFAAYAGRFARSEPAGDFPVQTLNQLPVTIPLALYTGGRSHPALRAIVAELAERLPHARVIDIPEANHAVQRISDQFVAAMLALVAEADDLAYRASAAPVGKS